MPAGPVMPSGALVPKSSADGECSGVVVAVTAVPVLGTAMSPAEPISRTLGSAPLNQPAVAAGSGSLLDGFDTTAWAQPAESIATRPSDGARRPAFDVCWIGRRT